MWVVSFVVMFWRVFFKAGKNCGGDYGMILLKSFQKYIGSSKSHSMAKSERHQETGFNFLRGVIKRKRKKRKEACWGSVCVQSEASLEDSLTFD